VWRSGNRPLYSTTDQRCIERVVVSPPTKVDRSPLGIVVGASGGLLVAGVIELLAGSVTPTTPAEKHDGPPQRDSRRPGREGDTGRRHVLAIGERRDSYLPRRGILKPDLGRLSWQA
jgi:hypothetical protein